MDDQETRAFEPPTVIDDIHRQPPSSTTVNLSDSTTLHLPRIPSPLSTTVEPIAPKSPIPAAIDTAILTTPSTSFHDTVATTTAVKTHNPLRLSDTNPSTTTTTPPEPARKNILFHRSHFDLIYTDSEETLKNKTAKSPPARIPSSPKSRTSPPGSSSSRKQNPQSKKMGDKIRELKRSLWKSTSRSEEHEDDNPSQALVDGEGCHCNLGWEKFDDGGCHMKGSCGWIFFTCSFVIFWIFLIIAFASWFYLFSHHFGYLF